MFSAAGIGVSNVNLVRDRYTGQPRGFGFVEVNSNEDAERAVQALNGQDLMGRNVLISEARPAREGGDFSGGSNRGGYGGSRGSGGDRSR